MKGSRLILILFLVASIGGVTLALVLKKQREAINARQKAKIHAVPMR